MNSTINLRNGRYRCSSISLVVLAFLLAPTPLRAQTVQVPRSAAPSNPSLPQQPPPQDIAPPVQRPSFPEPTPSPTPESPSLTQPADTSPKQPSPEIPKEIHQEFLVKKFQFVGSTVFKDEELLEAIEEALGFSKDQKLPRKKGDPAVKFTFARLLEARSAITDLYIKKGYITTGALIPEQTLPDGEVRIQIVEGEIEDIKVLNTRRLHQGYIRNRLALATRKPFNRNRLLEALQLLQQNPLIDSLSAELAAGSRFGSNLLEVTVKEASTLSGQVILDNNRSPSVGSFERGVQLGQANLLGIGDGLSVGYLNTDGSNEVNLSYTLPLSPHNTTLNFTYSYTNSNVIEAPFNILDIVARSRQYQLTLRHPVIQTPFQELALGLTFARQESETELGFLDTGPFPLSPGADNKGRTRISVLRLFQEWTHRSDFSALSLRSQFSLGLNVLNSTISDVPPDGRFFTWRGQAQWVRRLPVGILLVLRGDLQVADRRLVSLEQFGVGGQLSVRGYRQDFLLADNGVFGSIELRLPLFRNFLSETTLWFTPFVDLGSVWNNFEGADPNPNTLVSTGFGLRFQLGDRLDARFDWGFPLTSRKSPENTLQEQGIYFSLIWKAF